MLVFKKLCTVLFGTQFGVILYQFQLLFIHELDERNSQMLAGWSTRTLILIKDKAVRNSYEVALHNHFEALAGMPDNVENCWRVVRDSEVLLAKGVIGHRRRNPKSWLSAEADPVIILL